MRMLTHVPTLDSISSLQQPGPAVQMIFVLRVMCSCLCRIWSRVTFVARSDCTSGEKNSGRTSSGMYCTLQGGRGMNIRLEMCSVKMRSTPGFGTSRYQDWPQEGLIYSLPIPPCVPLTHIQLSVERNLWPCSQ